jgi:hypothetical protein
MRDVGLVVGHLLVGNEPLADALMAAAKLFGDLSYRWTRGGDLLAISAFLAFRIIPPVPGVVRAVLLTILDFRA